MNSNRMPSRSCPVCKYEMDAATCISEKKAKPSEGDLTLCLKCGEILIYGPEFKLGIPEIKDLFNLPSETSELLMRAQTLVRQERPIA